MALQPNLKALIILGSPGAPHTLEVYLDFTCPFSAKIALVIDSVLKPLLANQYPTVKLIFRPQVQPWHASSTLTHEAALAVLHVSPGNFWDYALLLFKHQEEYFDIPTSTQTPLQTREKLCTLAESIIGKDKAAEMKDLLTLKSTPNGGVAVTDSLKYSIKISRQNGIHVSPTVLWDGLIANEVSSSWGHAHWREFLQQRVSS